MRDSSRKIIFFDFDGVITDSVQLAHETHNLIWEPLTREEYLQRFDGNINDAVIKPKISGQTGVPGDYFQLYYPHVLEQALFPGVVPAIEKIYEEYPMLFIVSSNSTKMIEDYLDHHDLRRYFTKALGNEVSPKKTVKMAAILEEHATEAKDAVMITDTLGDIREAAAISVGSIAVTWGYQDGANLLKGSPHRLIELPEHLPDAIREYFIGAE